MFLFWSSNLPASNFQPPSFLNMTLPPIGQILFAALAGLSVISALGVVLLRHVVYGALFLGLCFASIGGLYALLGADFLFASQILIYVGAIAVLFLFVVLLSGRRAEFTAPAFGGAAFGGAVAAVVAAALLTGIYVRAKVLLQAASSPAGFKPTTASIGEAILGPHALGMEIMGLVLLVALVGASLLTPPAKKNEEVSVK